MMQGNLDSMSGEYINPNLSRSVDQKVLKLIAEYLIPRVNGESVLELGIGDQVWTLNLLKRFTKVTSVEGSQKIVEDTAKKIKEKHWHPVHSFFEDYEPDEKFDIVFATNILEHVDSPSSIFRLARDKWLRKGGILVVAVPHALSLHRRLAVIMGIASFPGALGESDHSVGHQRCFTCYEMHQLLVESGFNIIEYKGMFTKVIPNNLLVHCSDAQLKGLFKLGLELPVEYSASIYFIAEAISNYI